MEIVKLKIALIQTEVGENIEANLEKTAAFVKEAAYMGAKVVCLQELFATPYFAQHERLQNFELAMPIPSNISKYLCDLAKNNKIFLLGGSIYEKGEDGFRYNTCLGCDPNGEIKIKYRKVHIPHDPLYYEQYYFTPGNLGYPNSKIFGFTVAPLICYDQWFPEPARIHTLKGTQMIFYPTAIGWTPEMQKFEQFSNARWEAAMRAHASMNGIFVAAVNRVGKEEEITFWGGSFIADPFGEIIAKGSSNKEEIIFGEINTENIYKSQDGWGFLRNRRPDTYGGLTKIPK